MGFKFAARGIFYALKTQRNMRIHYLVALAALFLAWKLQVSVFELLWVVLAIFLVLIAELFNTAIEVLVDLVSPGHHYLAGIAKDVAAGAVLLSALHSLVVAFLVYGRYIF